MDERQATDAQQPRSSFWLVFSSLCAGGAILASIISNNNVQRYKAQQERTRQQMERPIQVDHGRLP
jgi:hypothetical protein